MKLLQSPRLEIRQVPGKGRGVFARENISRDEIIERVPLLILKSAEVETSELMDYAFVWGKDTVAIALGYGSIYNHSYQPNARYFDGPGRTKRFLALRNIAAGEEITVNYNADPADRDPVGFRVLENRAPKSVKRTSERRKPKSRAPRTVGSVARKTPK